MMILSVFCVGRGCHNPKLGKLTLEKLKGKLFITKLCPSVSPMMMLRNT
jgi:hypothetical protein